MKNMNINIEEVKVNAVNWVKDWFSKNGDGCNAIVGISGGKDSSVVAALCCEALGKDRVIGILMPNGYQSDISVSYEVCAHLGIKHYLMDIGFAVEGIWNSFKNSGILATTQTAVNLPARIRMAMLYAVSQSMNGRVANTCNLSEDYVGYATRYGDAAGDFSPLSHLTVGEVKLLGLALGLPTHIVDKTPTDGLCDKTDEENLGFSYETLDTYIRTGVCEDEQIKSKIDHMEAKNRFKLELMQFFDPFVIPTTKSHDDNKLNPLDCSTFVGVKAIPEEYSK